VADYYLALLGRRGGEPFKRAFVKRYFVKWRPEYERFVETRCRESLSGEFPRYTRAVALTFQMIYRQPVRHEFSLINPPTLLVVGLKDRTPVGGGAGCWGDPKGQGQL